MKDRKTCFRSWPVIALLLLAGPAAAQDVTGVVMDIIQEKAAEQIEKQLFGDTTETADDPGWDDYWRTSEQEGAPGADYGDRPKPPEGLRIGCICMDGSRRDERGRGACSGRGGVRYWLYQVDDSVVQYATDRHWEHPEPLSETERLNLSAYNTSPGDDDDEDRAAGAARQGLGFGLPEVLITMMVCLTMAYIARLWFAREAVTD